MSGRPTWEIREGDVRDRLREMPDQSVQCIVTTPPYWGLRDYGTATWEGGDPECEHENPRRPSSTYKTRDELRDGKAADLLGTQYRHDCPDCGATRQDSQLGLEPTPEAYVATMVEVFREARRVLRDDGTLWLNLGSSYVSGGTAPSQSPLLRRVPACDSGGKGSQRSQGGGRACPGSGGELRGETPSHRDHTGRTGQRPAPTEPQLLPTGRDSEPLGSASASPPASPHGALASTTPESSPQPLAASDPEATVSASPQLPETSSHGSRASAHTDDCTDDTSSMSPPLAVHTLGKESFFSACGRSDCKGIGRCGICWCNLAIPSLGLKAKDDATIPHLVAMALRADGWYLRSDIVWAKPNPMPESVTDRPTKAHEYVFLLTKSKRYFYDADAVRESVAPKTAERYRYAFTPAPDGVELSRKRPAGMRETPNGRNARSVWTIATQPYAEAHFATFPPELAGRCIRAGTSAKGCCPECGAPWERVVERTPMVVEPSASRNETDAQGLRTQTRGTMTQAPSSQTIGWRPTCDCRMETRALPCTVLDPFSGSGTTIAEAVRLGRSGIGIELNPDYAAMSRRRVLKATGRQPVEGTKPNHEALPLWSAP